MPPREPHYHIAIEGPVPEDLARRCAQAWSDIRLAAQHASSRQRPLELLGREDRALHLKE